MLFPVVKEHKGFQLSSINFLLLFTVHNNYKHIKMKSQSFQIAIFLAYNVSNCQKMVLKTSQSGNHLLF